MLELSKRSSHSLAARIAIDPGLVLGILLASAFAGHGLFAGEPGRQVATAEEQGPGDSSPRTGIPDGWREKVEHDLPEMEYSITWQDETTLKGRFGAWQGPNRAQGFRTYFTPQGILLTPRDQEPLAWTLGFSVFGAAGVGSAGSADGAALFPSGNRIDYYREGIHEWYVNDAQGLEQGFTIASPLEGVAGRPTVPPGRGPSGSRAQADGEGAGGQDAVGLILEMTGTLSARIEGRAVQFMEPGGARALRFVPLAATDATGREVAAHLEVSAEAGRRFIQLVVDAAKSAYPVTLRLLISAPTWTMEGNQASARFGVSVASAGDVNGDGYSDVIVGAHLYDNGQTDEGKVFVYLGSASGLSSTPGWTAEGNQASASFGYSVASAGDVNGDGYSDVIVGAYLYDNGQTDEGRAYVFYGSASGLSPTPNWTAESNQAGAHFGCSVATAGDVNGDGYSDVIVGANLYDNGQTDEGRVFVYHGSASGLASGPAWTAESNQTGAHFGDSVATAGDVNGDRYSDVIVGAPLYDNGQADEGRAFVYFGSASGLSPGPSWTAESDQAGAQFGISVAAAGDVNGDGYSDAIVGAYLYDNGQMDEGRASVYCGSASGLNSTPNWTAESDQVGAHFGCSVATAGDVNGDGYSDVIVGANLSDNGQTDEGKAFVYYGSATGLSSAPSWSDESNQASANFGTSVAAAGDVNGDGYSDLIIGAPLYDNGQTDEGRAFVYLGAPSAPAPSASLMLHSDQTNSEFAVTVAPAGDVNGDGYADLIVGDPYYNYGGAIDSGAVFLYYGSPSGISLPASWIGGVPQAEGFGQVVAPAGDVNGDGYSDVIVGYPFYYHSGVGQSGEAYVYYGSPLGLSSSPDWMADSGRAAGQFGRSVARAGDVNGDGYDDVIIGDPACQTGDPPSEVFVFYGSASGLSTSPGWVIQLPDPCSFYGWSVASAGDVNGDGYGDVIIGGPSADNGQGQAGRADVFEGSASGLSQTPAWTAKSDKPGSSFGNSVSTAGDVNGDGYSDVLVGATHYNDDQSLGGEVFGYYGSASGLSAEPSWSVNGAQAHNDFGVSVASAGDVNGDGFGDVLIGADGWDRGTPYIGGKAFLYLGSSSGLSPEPDWTASCDEDSAMFGTSVAAAWDVNGDGYSDVVVGAPLYSVFTAVRGAAFFYYGGGGRGLSLRPGQRRADDSVPIPLEGVSGSESSFRLALLGRSPFGRGGVKLEREVKPFGELFDGFATQMTGVWSDTGAGGVAMNELVGGLADTTRYHWRLRLSYDPVQNPFHTRSRWLSVPWGGWEQAQLPTTIVAPAGGIPDGTSDGGGALAVVPEANGDLTLSWGASCASTDSDYEVYEGVLGDFTSHASRICSTGGSTSATLTPATAGRYYLVVPRNALREGSYGSRTGGSERPPGTSACLPQKIDACQ